MQTFSAWVEYVEITDRVNILIQGAAMKFFRWILNGLMGIIIFFGLTLLLVRMAGICPYAVLSGSMEPEIPAGGMVFTDMRKREPKAGDVITYRIEKTTVTHRVVRLEDGFYVTKGDANLEEDAVTVLPSRVVGTVCFSLPFLGYVVSYLQNRMILSLVIVVYILLFLAESKPVFHENNKKRKGEREETRGKVI